MQPRYRGSPEHKTRPSRWGSPVRPCSNTPCPSAIPDDEVERVLEADLRVALERGHVSVPREGGWPRHLWGRSSFRSSDPAAGTRTVVWEARLTNRGAGEYKAYPISPDRHSDEMPYAVVEVLWPSD